MMCRPPAATTLSCRPLPVGPGALAAGLTGLRALLAVERGELGLQVAAEHDVGAAARHVGGDGHRARPPGLRDDVRLALVLLGIEHLVRDVLLLQQAREELGGLDRGGADQHRLLALARSRGCPR